MKLISSHNTSKTLNAENMETLIECQSEGDLKEHRVLASCDNEDNICQLIEVKKRKKGLSWPSLMRRLSHLSDFSGASEPELKTSLFDQPLSIICGDNDTLPKPIQDILTVLCLKGPSTEGIFRKAANEKARKELKEELNSGGAVELRGQPVHLLAVVFKDFLRGIPQKLLSCDLFEEWMGALEKQNEEDRIEALKQVAEKLPRPNLLLLKHLIYVLYLISKNSETNKMDASNLAICVGPNMLARDNDQNLSFEAQKDLNNKVKSLVEFLIDNCLEIFGENIPAHSSIASDDSLEHTDSSDTSTLHNDSAYDSNDPDVDWGSTLGSPCSQQQVPSDQAASWAPQSTERQSWELSREPTLAMVARLRGTLGASDRSYSEPSMPCAPRDPESQRLSPLLGRQVRGFQAEHSDSEDPEDPFPEEEAEEEEDEEEEEEDEEEATPGAEGPAQRLLDPSGKQTCPRAPQAPRGSLDTSSEGSPTASPASPKRGFFTRHQSFTRWERSKPQRTLKKHSLSFSFPSPPRMLPTVPSASPASCRGCHRDQPAKGPRKETRLAGRMVRESLWDWPGPMAPLDSSSARMLGQLDQQRAGHPPSYQEAIRTSGLAASGCRTVGSMRARMLSLDAGRLPLLPAQHAGDALDGHTSCPGIRSWKPSETVCASADTTEPGRPELHRLTTMTESRPADKRDSLLWRCSQPVFEAEQLQCAKESYI
ncbi:T-cell activation Rho GTPase-activating protein [Sorex fumeus]|uniref:T-cell activation Rho GTPase-activating protein n=1 Tax=Sorex fumeus TaxID=62283 RepID=UPI0024ADF292|nr:T-cell activation Rho GTPase-activating protein [Sorex fumeus]